MLTGGNVMPEGVRSHLQVGSNKLLLGALVSVGIVFAIFTWILWRFGFFSFSGTDASTKIVAASISLVGGLIGSIITFVGVILKHSIDQRSIALQEESEIREKIESARDNRLKIEAERRLMTEASIQAIGLLSTSSGTEVTLAQRAGVILTLADLDKMSLALSLTDQMLLDSTLDITTAVWLFNKGLSFDKDPDIQLQSAILTDKHVAKMLQKNGEGVFPPILLKNEILSLEVNVRRNAVNALIDLLMLRPFADWDPGPFCTVLDSIHYVWKKDPDEDIQDITGIALFSFIKAFEPDEKLRLRSNSSQSDLPPVSKLSEELTEYADKCLPGRLLDGRLRSPLLAKWVEELKKESK
jgi:hypothetical protein